MKFHQYTQRRQNKYFNIEEDTLQIPNYLEFGNDDISKETKTPSKDIFESVFLKNQPMMILILFLNLIFQIRKSISRGTSNEVLAKQ